MIINEHNQINIVSLPVINTTTCREFDLLHAHLEKGFLLWVLGYLISFVRLCNF